MPALIVKVERSSIADDIGLAPGDTLISIDGKEINDILDYHFWVRSEQLELSIEKADGKIWTVEIEKDYDEDLGLEFEDLLFDRIKSCQNRCVFCFIDQLPRHMRKTLYIKDDDYRHSFLFGNFITLSNLREEDWEKIITMRLSPLYISVHALQEVLIIGRRLREQISRGQGADDAFEKAAIAEGMLSIKADGIEKAKEGFTSLEEVMKAVLMGG
jgi:putative radical SAM enzyme (TIGR03279 family)